MGYESCCYWVAWIFQWEKKNKRMKQKFEIDEREIKDIKKAIGKMLFGYYGLRLSRINERDPVVKQIYMYQLFKYQFTGPKRNLRTAIYRHWVFNP